MNLVEIESKISVLESTRDDAARRANADMMPLQNQLNAIAMKATETLARIDGQLSVLGDLRKELLPAPVGTTPEPVPDSVA